MIGRRSFLRSLLALCAAATGGAGATSADRSRVALVIGNNGYPQHPLGNAVNDARAVAEVLSGAGFSVVARTDTTRESMGQAVRDFGAALADPAVRVGAFYYAGHGVQVDWRNYLLPVDMRLRAVSDLPKQGLDLGDILGVLPRASGKTFIIILDACRDNPFGESLTLERKGLTPFDAPAGTLIAFSTSPGNVASDGAGANGLYTENLVRELRVHGLRLEDVFKRVRVNVSLASRGMQIPWESTSLLGDVYVFPPDSPLTEDQLERRFEEEVAEWNRVKGSKNPADWAGLLRSFPNGKLSEIAQARLNSLLAQSAGAATSRGLRIKPAVVRLGEGLPVPEYFQRDANPNSAGAYPLDRQFSVGDNAVYTGDGFNSDFPRSRRVIRVDSEGERVFLNDGRLVTDSFGNPVSNKKNEYRVPVQIVPAELQVGRRWSASLQVNRGGVDMNEEATFVITRREEVAVPAGRFDAFRIEGTKSSVARQQSGRPTSLKARWEEITYWEVPGLNFPVKEASTLHRRNGLYEEVTRELVSLAQGGGTDGTPADEPEDREDDAPREKKGHRRGR